MISAILGGIGLFLLGMVLMTEGLKSAAGEALRRVLSRLTGGALQAFLSGAGLTLMVQSSSATILATIGFVSAGLLTFTQSVGVILGAATGTTSTGWIVSLLGLRLKISVLALPLVGIGALMRLLMHGRGASIGLALAGFGLIFVGIDTLQGGMQALSEHLDPAMIPGGTVAGRLLLIAFGVAMTVVMQSSSAAVATTLTALHAGTLGLDQAALLVIGQNMGTSVTAALASIGAAIAAKRTALAHVLFNTFAGLLGLALLPLYLHALGRVRAAMGGLDDAIAIAAFHTGFNLLAVAILLPVLGSFAVLVSRLLPERGPQLTRNLDASVAEVAPVAIEAARRTTLDIGAVLLDASRRLLLGTPPHALQETLETADRALAETRRFLGRVRTSRDAPQEHRRHLSVLHAIDHFDRMLDALRDDEPPRVLLTDPNLAVFSRSVAEQLTRPLAWLQAGDSAAPLETVREMSQSMAAVRRAQRPRLMTRTAAGELDPDHGLAQLDAMRWLDRLAYHTWRALEHLGGDAAPAAGEMSTVPAEAGADQRA